jgi:hypothetical protein
MLQLASLLVQDRHPAMLIVLVRQFCDRIFCTLFSSRQMSCTANAPLALKLVRWSIGDSRWTAGVTEKRTIRAASGTSTCLHTRTSAKITLSWFLHLIKPLCLTKMSCTANAPLTLKLVRWSIGDSRWTAGVTEKRTIWAASGTSTCLHTRASAKITLSWFYT